MRQILDITFVRICLMRKNYKSKFNELTPVGWVVVVLLAISIITIFGIIINFVCNFVS